MLLLNIFYVTALSLLSSLIAPVAAVPAHKDGSPIPPEAQLLFQLKMNLGQSVSFGIGPRGNRFSDPILGGSFEGPKLTGTVLPVGANWGLLDARGGFLAITIFQFQTADGANIFVRGTGPTPNGKGLFYISLETGAENYYWVNDIMVVGTVNVDREKGFVTIDAWQLIPPVD
ncbi:uncharacterized protein CTRU02_213296 [Colletotrichum truncatum]|uniref:Uncharacterized protein n=1 Tax=Colletotrichum truncatum TaxID=5467 RepID=A0ACC3YK99_COLTU|nr:uncharacterized protein CTRU02_12676 [Colletotrichum truncatum]KAF6784414.1 hypothetical protein CTRU02_12676 [Colletotrichum truncatum]